MQDPETTEAIVALSRMMVRVDSSLDALASLMIRHISHQTNQTKDELYRILADQMLICHTHRLEETRKYMPMIAGYLDDRTESEMSNLIDLEDELRQRQQGKPSDGSKV
jgi:hypothetical protein